MSQDLYEYGYVKPPKLVNEIQSRYQTIEQQLGIRDVDPNTGALTLNNGKQIRGFIDAVWEKSKEVKKTKKKDGTVKYGVERGLRLLELDLPQYGTLDTVKVIRWCMVEAFNPSSSPQVIKYLKWRKQDLASSVDLQKQKLAEKYKIPTRFKDGAETTNSKELKELAEITGDPLLFAIMDYRSVCTNLNNYYPNWEPNQDTNCVHPTFGFVPPGGQLNSIEPNVQNLSKHTKYGQIFRRMVEAKQGHVFVELDKSRFHVAMMGREANSARYIRFARLDSHSIFTSWIINEPSLRVDIEHDSDEVALAKIKEIKARYGDIRDQQAKPAVLGNQLGLGARKMHFMNRKGIPSIRHAEKLQAILSEAFPEVEAWKKMITNLAARQRYIVTEFGFIRWFYDVLRPKWNKAQNRWDDEPGHGDDFEKALAIKIQSNSFCHMKSEWKEMVAKHDAMNRYEFINTIHDSNVFHPTLGLLEECVKNIFRVMLEPCVMLASPACPTGLIVGTGVSVGRNMQSYYDKTDGKKPFNPEGMREVGVKMVDGEVRIDWPKECTWLN